MKIKICVILSGLNRGGVETFIKNYFSLIDLNKYELYIVTYQILDESIKLEFESMGFKVFKICSKRQNIVYSLYQLYKIFSKYNFDIVHSNMIKSNFINLFIAKLNGVTRRISHSHNVFYGNNFINKIIAYFNYKTATEYVACSKAALISGFGDRVLSEKYCIIKNPINYEKFIFNKGNRIKIRKKLGLKKDDILLGNIARFTTQKNHLFLIKVIKDLVSLNKKYKLLLIGDGPKKKHIKKLIKKNNLDYNVIILESIKDVFCYYSALDIFLFPSLYEGFGIVAVESQISGLKTIISNCVPDEVIISNNIIKLPLIKKLWIDEILKTNSKYKRKYRFIDNYIDFDNYLYK